jgi:hypothetical protein
MSPTRNGVRGSRRARALARASVAFLTAASAVRAAEAAEYYVSPTGSDSAAGSIGAPWATLSKAASTASAGDTVYFRAGTYPITTQTRLSRSGTSDANRIRFFGYPDEHAVLDCSKYRTTNRAADTPCILVTGSYLHIKGFEILGTPVGASGDHSISTLRSNDGSNNTYELLDIHHSFGPGLFIDAGTGGNLILNSDSHDNYDKNGSQGDGQNGDGFGVHYQTTGPSTIIRGCRAWLNSDDGYDLISQEVPVTIEDSWGFQNGYANGGSTSPSSGNGNGFKVGSSKTGIRHVVRKNVAWKNKAAGFYANHSSGGNTWLNNTSYMNGTQYNMLASPPNDTDQTIILTGDKVHRMRNNVGFPNKNSNMGGVETMSNTWDLGIAEPNAFVTTSDAGATGPRQADGSMPPLDFLRPKAGGVLIDRGVDVMLPYVGTAPDLGAYEYGASTAGGAGGMAGAAGMGGMPGAGGAASGSGGAGTAGAAGTDLAGGGGMPETGGAGGHRASGGTSTSGGMTNGGGGSVTGGGMGAGTGGGVTGGAGGSAGTSPVGRGGAGATGAIGATAGSGAMGGSGGEISFVDPEDPSGCTCTVPAPSTSLTPLAAFSALLGLLVARARRRRRGRLPES